MVEAVHNRNIIHRDIKPGNFLVGCGEQSGKLFLVDFGLSTNYRHSATGRHIPYNSSRALSWNRQIRLHKQSHEDRFVFCRRDSAVTKTLRFLFCFDLDFTLRAKLRAMSLVCMLDEFWSILFHVGEVWAAWWPGLAFRPSYAIRWRAKWFFVELVIAFSSFCSPIRSLPHLLTSHFLSRCFFRAGHRGQPPWRPGVDCVHHRLPSKRRASMATCSESRCSQKANGADEDADFTGGTLRRIATLLRGIFAAINVPWVCYDTGLLLLAEFVRTDARGDPGRTDFPRAQSKK